MISERLGQTGEQPGVCSTLGHSRSESIYQPLQNISWPRPNSNLSIEMSTYSQSFPSFAASNDDNPTGLFAGATFQNCAFTFGSFVAHLKVRQILPRLVKISGGIWQKSV